MTKQIVVMANSNLCVWLHTCECVCVCVCVCVCACVRVHVRACVRVHARDYLFFALYLLLLFFFQERLLPARIQIYH